MPTNQEQLAPPPNAWKVVGSPARRASVQDSQKQTPVAYDSMPVPTVAFTTSSPSPPPGLKIGTGDEWTGSEVGTG